MPHGERPQRVRRPSAPSAQAVSWAKLTEVLGPPPRPPAQPGDYANGWNAESSPNSRAAAKTDCARFEAAMGRPPTREEQRMIEQRHLGWGYQ